MRTPAAPSKPKILHLYVFKFVNQRWRLQLLQRMVKSEKMQAERENTNVLTVHNYFGIVNIKNLFVVDDFLIMERREE